MDFWKSRMAIARICFFTGLLSCLSCGIKAQHITTNEIEQAEPRLVFLNYTISNHPSEGKRVQLINKVIADGRLKDASHHKPLFGMGDIACTQLDSNQVVLERTYLKNPLAPVMEYLNDDGQLEKRELQLESAQFSIKLQLRPRTASIRLWLIDASGKATSELITTTIP